MTINLKIMNPQPKTSAKDFFLNLGAIVALYTIVISLINLLFTIINTAYPQINNGYNYVGSTSISWPVAILIIFFPIFVLLVWLLEKGFESEPEKKHLAVRRWLSYITLFVAGLAMSIDLVTVIYYFIDGQELTVGFLLKVASVLLVTVLVFLYYISDLTGKLNKNSRKIWLIMAVILVLGSIAWGFFVLGSPRTQRLYKYDNQKINSLMEINNQITNYYSTMGVLPETLSELITANYYIPQFDEQTQKPFEYQKTGKLTYNLCAEFNKESVDKNKLSAPALSYPQYGGVISWTHPVGRYCFEQTVNPNMYSKPVLIR